MNRLKITVLLAALFVTSSVYAESLPKDISLQLPKGYEVMTFLGGELNDDKLTDYLVVAHIKNEEAIYQKTQDVHLRPLFIFIQNKNESYSLTKRNDNVVFTIDSGGQCDPFMDGEDGLALKNHFFTVQNSVACGQHWQDFITFKYDSKLKDWVFHKRIVESWHLNDSDDPNAEALIEDKPQVTKANPKKPISFDQYKP
jgi:hypothetical protein